MTAPASPLHDDNRSPRQASQTVRALLGLRDAVLQGELPAGTRLSEQALVERLGASRTPVRAALLRLQEEGLIDALPGGGFAVRSFSEEEIYDAIEVRGALEGLAARLAAERGVSPATLGALRDCVADIDRILEPSEFTLERFETYVTANDTFHHILLDLPGSDVIRRQLERAAALPFASPSSFVMVQARLPSARTTLAIAQEQHRTLIDALERREGARAEALMREHARIAHRNLEAALRNQNVMQLVPGATLIRRRGERG